VRADDRSSGSLHRRALMHAALGEPVRLAIVDGLVLGDASPGELSSLTGLASNLLAFHLRVLDEAGLVRRTRSEGDRRRSYLQLRREDPLVAAVVPAAPVLSAPRVVFVCTANSARSHLAAAAWTRVSPVPTASAGTRPAAQVHQRAVDTAHRHGLRLGRVRPHHVRDVLGTDDLVVAVCDNAHEELARIRNGPRDWLHWAVPDPVASDTDVAFESAYADLRPRIERLAAALVPGPR